MTRVSEDAAQAQQSSIDLHPANMRADGAAEYLQISASNLAKMRMRDSPVAGPPFCKVGGCVIYRKTDLDEWLAQHAITSPYAG